METETAQLKAKLKKAAIRKVCRKCVRTTAWNYSSGYKNCKWLCKIGVVMLHSWAANKAVGCLEQLQRLFALTLCRWLGVRRKEAHGSIWKKHKMKQKHSRGVAVLADWMCFIFFVQENWLWRKSSYVSGEHLKKEKSSGWEWSRQQGKSRGSDVRKALGLEKAGLSAWGLLGWWL